MSAGKRYTPGCSGFVVESRMEWTHPRTGEPVVRYSVWYGPDRSWGTTYGGLDYSSAVFASRPAARKAFETIRAWSSRERVRRVADVEADLRAQGRAWLPTLQFNDGSVGMYAWTTPEFAVIEGVA